MKIQKAFPLLSPSGRVARRAERGLFKISPYVAPSLACIKLSALFQGFPSGGGSLRSKVVRGSFKFDLIFYNRKQATPLIRRRSATPSPCLHKILLTKFSSAKIVSRYAASPRGEGYIIALFHAFPLGGRC